jgi:SH3 domain-containing YSC84-like protein 1
MGTILRGRNWYIALLLMAVVLTGMMIVPQQTSAQPVQEKLQDQEAKTIINHALSTWQNFMQDPDMSGFRAYVKEGQGVLIFPRLMKGAFVLGAEGGNGLLLVRHDGTSSLSEPVFYEISSASFGLQAGMETSEAILIIQTVKGIENLLENTIKLGSDVSAAIGPRGGGVEGVTSMS